MIGYILCAGGLSAASAACVVFFNIAKVARSLSVDGEPL